MSIVINSNTTKRVSNPTLYPKFPENPTEMHWPSTKNQKTKKNRRHPSQPAPTQSPPLIAPSMKPVRHIRNIFRCSNRVRVRKVSRWSNGAGVVSPQCSVHVPLMVRKVALQMLGASSDHLVNFFLRHLMLHYAKRMQLALSLQTIC